MNYFRLERFGGSSYKVKSAGHLFAQAKFLRKPRSCNYVQHSNSIRLWMQGMKGEAFAESRRMGLTFGLDKTRKIMDELSESVMRDALSWTRALEVNFT